MNEVPSGTRDGQGRQQRIAPDSGRLRVVQMLVYPAMKNLEVSQTFSRSGPESSMRAVPYG
jgi:hypothetical protein